ncbi:hypothetical protein ACQ86B_26710 [Mycolicibacterium aichiense]|uniref:hypothetical protein n=1 Tax=Mycolicibacterium aichiense TaxID=1799 RepID=UPI003D66FDF0
MAGPELPCSGVYPRAVPPMTVLIVVAKVALVAFLVVGIVTIVVTFVRRRRRREPLPPWSPTGYYYGYARTPLPPWVDEYGTVIDPDDDPPGTHHAGHA